MSPYFIAHFKTQADHNRFLTWLTAWEQENKFDTESKIRFLRDDGHFSVWTVHCSDANLETLSNAVTAFNTEGSRGGA